jgi:hypothetical protein
LRWPTVYLSSRLRCVWRDLDRSLILCLGLCSGSKSGRCCLAFSWGRIRFCLHRSRYRLSGQLWITIFPLSVCRASFDCPRPKERH